MGWTQASKAKNVSSVKKPLSISVSHQPRGVVECIAWCRKYLNPLNLNCRQDLGLMYSTLYVKDPAFTGLKSVQAALHQIIPCNLQTILFQMTFENNNKYSFLIKTIIFPFWPTSPNCQQSEIMQMWKLFYFAPNGWNEIYADWESKAESVSPRDTAAVVAVRQKWFIKWKEGEKFLSLHSVCQKVLDRRPKNVDFYRRCGICYILFSFTFYPPKPVTNYRVRDSCVSGIILTFWRTKTNIFFPQSYVVNNK